MSSQGKIPLMGCFEFIHYYKTQYLADALFVERFAAKHDWDVSPELFKKAKENTTAVVITDAKQNIVWTSNYFEILTGYDRIELIGKNPNVLQGKDTCSETKARIKSSLEAEKPFEGIILNYTKTGEPYDCEMDIMPLYNRSGELVHYLAFERPYSEA